MELLAKLRGEDPFHMAPLEVGWMHASLLAWLTCMLTHGLVFHLLGELSQVAYMGTPKNPVKVFSLVGGLSYFILLPPC